MKRVFEADVLRCPRCGGVRKVLAFVMEAAAVRRVLAHLGLPAEAPVLAPARGPPDELPFE
ncbi:MAG: ATP-dependent helicase HrpA [Planctomycetota bacterium]